MWSYIWHTAGSNILNYSDNGQDQAYLKMESAETLHHSRPPDRLPKHSLAKWGQWEILSNVLKWSVEKILISRLQWVWGVDLFMWLRVGTARSVATDLRGDRCLNFHFPFRMALSHRKSETVSGRLLWCTIYVIAYQCLFQICLKSRTKVTNSKTLDFT